MATSPASETATTQSSTKASTQSPVGSAARWHPAGTDRSEAERLAARLAAECNGRNDEAPIAHLRGLPDQALAARARSSPWPPAPTAATSTRPSATSSPPSAPPGCAVCDHTTSKPSTTGCCTPPTIVERWHPRSVYEVHLIIRGALGDAVRRGLITRNVALVAHAPRLRSIPKVEQQAWTAEELQLFLRAAAGHRLFPALWLSAMTGMRRSELLGLRWTDIDFDKATVSINRGLVAIGYELHESRGKTDNSRRSHRPRPHHHHRPTRLAGPPGRRIRRRRYQRFRLGVRRRRRPTRSTHTPSRQTFERIARRAGVPVIRLHDLRHTHGTLLIKDRRPGEGRQRTPRSRQHRLHHRDLPARPARHASATPPAPSKRSSRRAFHRPPLRPLEPVEHPGEHGPNPVEHHPNDEGPGR